MLCEVLQLPSIIWFSVTWAAVWERGIAVLDGSSLHLDRIWSLFPHPLQSVSRNFKSSIPATVPSTDLLFVLFHFPWYAAPSCAVLHSNCCPM